MIIRKILLASLLLISTVSFGQSLGLNGTGGAGGISNGSFDQLKSTLGYKAVYRGEKFRVDGTPYLFENWDQGAVIVTKGGNTLKFKDVNFDGRRNKIVARINKDSIYTFNSLAISKAIINGKVFKNIVDPNDGPLKVYEVIAESPEFTILKDYTVDISEGSSNPMRGTVYSKYIKRENYKILTDKELDKFVLKKKKILKLLSKKGTEVKNYAEEKDLNYKDEKDVNDMILYYSEL